jgi:DNA-binding transcriptional LysR family regulator
MNVEIRDLRALLTVVRCGSFTAAAKELGYTQSAVSQQVAALEAEVGQLLVQRRPVRATPAGERLAEHAAHVLLRLEVARSELSHISGEQGNCRIAAGPLATPAVLAAALRDLRSTSPLIEIEVHTSAPAAGVAEVAEGTADVALVDGLTTPNEPLHLADAGLLVSLPLSESPLVVALQAGHPLALRSNIDLDMLSDVPFVLEPVLAGDVAGRRPLVPERSRSVKYRGDDVATVTALITAGLGVALLPAHAVMPGRSREQAGGGILGGSEIAVVPLGRPRLVHRTEVLSRRNPTGAQLTVIEALRQAASRA